MDIKSYNHTVDYLPPCKSVLSTSISIPEQKLCDYLYKVQCIYACIMHRTEFKGKLNVVIPRGGDRSYLLTPYYTMKNGKYYGNCASLSKTSSHEFHQEILSSLQLELKFLWPWCKVPGQFNPELCDTGEVEHAPLKRGPLYSWKVWDSSSELCSLQFPSNLNCMWRVLLCFPVIFMQGKAKFCPFCCW